MDDLTAAVAYICAHSDEFEVDESNYTIWGSSFGGYLAHDFCSSASGRSYRDHDLPEPDAEFLIYPALYSYEYASDDPKVFCVMSQDDPLYERYRIPEEINKLMDAGIEVQFEEYATGGHGYGLGIGTEAEGWIYDAITFWQGLNGGRFV